MYRDINSRLRKIGNIPVNLSVLEAQMKELSSPGEAVLRLERQSAIIRLKRGLYVVNSEISEEPYSPFLIANHLYGPSYVSMHAALRYYGLIPEQVKMVDSMTIKRSRSFTNALGEFRYTSCTPEYYAIGTHMESRSGRGFLIATPEKALCDLIVSTPNLNLRYMREITEYLEEDMRMDIDDIRRMDAKIFEECLAHSKKKPMIAKIIELIKR